MLSKIKKGVGLGARAAEAALKPKKTARDEAIIEAREASKRGFLEPSKEKGRWYHGTTADIEEFKPGKRGAVFFSQDPAFASDYAPAEAIYFGKELATQPNVMPVHLQVRNPFDYENPEHVEMVMQTAKFGKSVNPQVARDNLELGNYNFIEDKNVQQAIRDLGFDSFYIKEHGLKNIGVFDPRQIKSAVGMEGRYDIEDPNITKAAGGAVDAYQAQQQSQSKRAQDVAAYKEGKIGADELLKYYPGLTATMIEEQLAEMAIGGPIEVKKKAGGPVFSQDQVFADLGDPSTVMTFGSLAMAKGGEVKMQAGGGAEHEGFFESGMPPETQPSDTILVGRGVRRKRPQVGEILETPTAAVKNVLGAMGSAALGAGQATVGLGGDIESIASGIGSALRPGEGEGRLDAFLRGMEEETLLPTTEDVKKFTEQYVTAPFEQFETLGQFTGIPIVVSPKFRGAVKKGIEAITPEGRPIPVGMSTESVGQTVPEVLEAAAKPKEIKAPANELGLFSGLEKAALNLERKQGSGDAFLNDLKKLATKYGVSKEEFEYSGLENYLKGKKSVTRDDVQDFAQRNRYSMSEVEYKASKGDTSEMEFRGDVVDDPDYIDERANDLYREFDEYYGKEARQKTIDEIESNYTPEELADPGIRRDVDNLIEERLRTIAQENAYAEYWEDPFYRSQNDLGYEVSGTDNGGYSVTDPRGNRVGDWFRDRESAEGAANQHAMEQGLISEGETQYHDYQLPQGENYRELLLQNSIAEGPRLTKKELALYEDLKNRELGFISGRISTNINDEERALLKDLKTKIDLSNKFENFTEGHWNEPDVIAHMRIQDRVTTDGKPMLYVDEMQSDWHQEGLKHGYRDKTHKEQYAKVYEDYLAKKEIKDKVDSDYNDAQRDLESRLTNEFFERMQRTPTTKEFREIEAEAAADPKVSALKEIAQEKNKEYDKVKKEYSRLTEAVPDAPFKETWHELGIKRMLNYAAKNGYDRIGFSSASPQIKRWGTQEIAWEKAPAYQKTKEDFAKWLKSKAKEEVPESQFNQAVDQAWGDALNGVYQAFLKQVENPQGWKVAATEQRGGMAGRVNLEAEARARGVLKERPTKTISSQEELRQIIDDTTRGMSEEQIDRLTKKTWERMQKFDTGISAPREEGMRAFYDQKMKNTLQKYAERLGAKFYESETKVGRGIAESGGYQDLTEPVYIIEFTDKARNSALKGQAYKKGGLVQKEQSMAAGGIAKLAKVGAKAGKEIADKRKAIQGAIESVSSRLAKDAEKNKSKPIASEKVIENTVTKAAERITKQNPKLSEEEVAKKAEREALAKLKWEREEKLAIEARYGELEAAKFDEPKSKRMRNVPEVVERRIEKAEEFLAQPTEAWQPPRTELQAFDRSLIREALEGFPGIEQTRFPRAQATRADLGYLEEIYGDPRNRALIEKQIKRGLPLGGETFYASLYPIKVAAMERGIPEAKFNQWVYENAPASARNSILNEMAVGQFLRDMNARGLPLDEQTVTEEMAKFKQQYGIGLPLMPVHREGVRSVIEGGQDLREMVKADIPTNYKIPTYGTQKAGDFGKSMVLDVHESAGQTMGSRYHPYFTEQGGFAPLEYGPAEAKMLEIAESLGIPGGMAQAGRWFGGGELTGLKSPRGDALDLLEKQTAYTLQGLGIKPTPKTVRNYILDMIETGQGVLMPYFKSEPLPDVRTKKRGGLAKASKARGGLAALQA